MGLLRTRLDAVLPAARLGGRTVPLAPELFAIMADARLAWGQISAQRYSCGTADGAGKNRKSALRRLARCVCADLEEIEESEAMAIAGQACRRQKEILVAAVSRQAEEHGLEKVVAAGTGECLQDLCAGDILFRQEVPKAVRVLVCNNLVKYI